MINTFLSPVLILQYFDATIHQPVRGEHDVGVLLLQLGPEVPVVVDLSVDGEGGVPGVVGDGLGPGQQPVDGEPLVCEVAALEASDAIPVRTSVSQEFGEREKL